MILLSGIALAAPLDVDTRLDTEVSRPQDAAVVIGIEHYAYLPEVPHALRDAEAVRSWLVHTRGIPADRVEVLLDGQARAGKIAHALERLHETVGPDGTAWVYFAGHGAASPTDGQRLLLGVTTSPDPEVFEDDAVQVAALVNAAGGGEVPVVLLVDACYTGRGRDGAALLEGERLLVPTWATEPRAGVLEWTAAQAGQTSGPLDGARHGAFTWAVLAALRGEADGALGDPRDGVVTAAEGRVWVEKALRAEQVHTQTPRLDATSATEWTLATGLPVGAPTPDPRPGPGLTSAQVTTALAGRTQALHDCQLARPSATGALLVRLSIAADGTVTAEVVSDSVAAPPVTDCVLDTLRATAFPRSGGATQVDVPLTLR